MHESDIQVGALGSDRTINLLSACARAVGDTWTAAHLTQLGRGGSSPAAALIALATFGALTIDQLARTLSLSHSGASRCVDRLAERAWVERLGSTDSPTADRRAVSVQLTPDGAEAAQQLLRDRQAGMEQLLAPLSEEDQQRLGELLATVVAAQASDRASLRRVCRNCDHLACSPCPALAQVERLEQVGRAAG